MNKIRIGFVEHPAGFSPSRRLVEELPDDILDNEITMPHIVLYDYLPDAIEDLESKVFVDQTRGDKNTLRIFVTTLGYTKKLPRGLFWIRGYIGELLRLVKILKVSE